MLPEMIKQYLSIHWWHLCMFLPFVSLLIVGFTGNLERSVKWTDKNWNEDLSAAVWVTTILVSFTAVGAAGTLLIVK